MRLERRSTFFLSIKPRGQRIGPKPRVSFEHLLGRVSRDCHDFCVRQVGIFKKARYTIVS